MKKSLLLILAAELFAVTAHAQIGQTISLAQAQRAWGNEIEAPNIESATTLTTHYFQTKIHGYKMDLYAMFSAYGLVDLTYVKLDGEAFPPALVKQILHDNVPNAIWTAGPKSKITDGEFRLTWSVAGKEGQTDYSANETDNGRGSYFLEVKLGL